jgi:hypothetical protein
VCVIRRKISLLEWTYRQNARQDASVALQQTATQSTTPINQPFEYIKIFRVINWYEYHYIMLATAYVFTEMTPTYDFIIYARGWFKSCWKYFHKVAMSWYRDKIIMLYHRCIIVVVAYWSLNTERSQIIFRNFSGKTYLQKTI